MNCRRAAVLLLPLVFLFCVSAQSLVAQLPPPPAATPEFKERPYGPLPAPTKEPKAKPKDVERKPIPLGWLIGGAASAVLGIAGILYGASKAWHSSNLFDREYRFPSGGEAALRFGGKRCGGHMATVQFGNPTARSTREPARSEAKNI
jgi:hypothetical protein